MDEEQLWKLLDSLHGHIRAFDTKAQVALGLDSLLAGLIGTEIAKSVELSSWHVNASTICFSLFAALSVILLLASVAYAVKTTLPRIRLKQPKSHFFFCHLVESYGRRFDEARKSLIALREDQIAEELATQVQANAIICEAKSIGSQTALRLMVLSLVFYLISFVPFGTLAYRHARGMTVVQTRAAGETTPSSSQHTIDSGK